MNDHDISMLSAKLVQIQRLRDSILPAFPLLKDYYELEVSRLTASLILENDDVTRGRIQQLLEVLRLPHKLDDEIANLSRILTQPDEDTTQQGLDGLNGLWRLN